MKKSLANISRLDILSWMQWITEYAITYENNRFDMVNRAAPSFWFENFQSRSFLLKISKIWSYFSHFRPLLIKILSFFIIYWNNIETNLAEINLVKRNADKISHCLFFSLINLSPIGHLMTAYQTADCERRHILVVLKDELTILQNRETYDRSPPSNIKMINLYID